MKFGMRAEDFAELGPRIRQAITEIYAGLQKRLTFHDNVNMLLVTKTFGAVAGASNDVDISGLGIDWTPSYFITIQVNDGAVLYPNDVAHTGWTNQLIKVKSTMANTQAVIGVF